jgi:hypothetical protein
MTTDNTADTLQIRYVGFDHLNASRAFHFDVLSESGAKTRYTVEADLGLFPQHGVVVQEGPALCAQKLGFNLANGITECHKLTADDLRSHVAERQQRASARKGKWRLSDLGTAQAD